METQIDTLIEKVKSYGINEGKKAAAQILESAKKEAQKIIADAKKETNRMIVNAQSEVKILEQRGKDALKHAHRDLLLVVRSDLEKIFNAFLKTANKEVLSKESLKDIIIKALSQWDFNEKENIFISLSHEDAKQITGQVIESALKKHNGSISVSADSSVSKGFLISRASDGTGKFDFTDEAIAQSLITFLTPVLRELFK